MCVTAHLENICIKYINFILRIFKLFNFVTLKQGLDVILSEISQTQKDNDCVVLLMLCTESNPLL